MGDFLSAYSIQNWLEACPQGYLEGTVYGHEADQTEPEIILNNEVLREESIRTTVQLVVAERCALAASAGLIGSTPDEASKRFLATQTLDEARHVEIFTQRLYDLGVAKGDLSATIHQYANPHLLSFAEVLLEKIDKKDFLAGVVGQNIILEGLAFTVFEMIQTIQGAVNPKFARMLAGTIADERRHVGFGEHTIRELIRQHPEKKTEIERMQRDMSYHMLATFAEEFRDNPMPDELRREESRRGLDPERPDWRGADLSQMEPEELEDVLADTVLEEFKNRLERCGVEYHTPVRP